MLSCDELKGSEVETGQASGEADIKARESESTLRDAHRSGDSNRYIVYCFDALQSICNAARTRLFILDHLNECELYQ